MAYPAKTIAKAKLLYEQGHGREAISAKMGIADRTIQNWIEKCEWVKGALLSKIAQKQEMSLLQKAEKIGLTQELLLNKAKELVEAESLAIPTGTGFTQIPLSPYKNTNQRGKYEFMGIDEELEVVPDRKAQVEGMKIATDILKLRDKDINITFPEPIIIREPGGQVIETIETKQIR